jgi:hypothetical protein
LVAVIAVLICIAVIITTSWIVDSTIGSTGHAILIVQNNAFAVAAAGATIGWAVVTTLTYITGAIAAISRAVKCTVGMIFAVPRFAMSITAGLAVLEAVGNIFTPIIFAYTITAVGLWWRLLTVATVRGTIFTGIQLITGSVSTTCTAILWTGGAVFINVGPRATGTVAAAITAIRRTPQAALVRVTCAIATTVAINMANIEIFRRVTGSITTRARTKRSAVLEAIDAVFESITVSIAAARTTVRWTIDTVFS